MSTATTTRTKALEINKTNSFYGTFAEIGAGQEVARHFFQAGLASQTVAKSMSAYDKVFSDSIYGKGSRFVSEERLIKMLSHEYSLLDERLCDRKGHTCFFSFANTVATSSHEEIPSCHGWMGIRFQKRFEGPANEIIIHVRMLDRLRLQQQEALGILGVNLIYAARNYTDAQDSLLIASLLDNLSTDRIEINFIRFSGPDVEHIDNRLMSLELVKQNLTRAVMFNAAGQSLSLSDTIYGKSVLVQRGKFRPFTLTNERILENGLRQMEKDLSLKKKETVVLLEMTMSHLATGKDSTQDNKSNLEIDKKDFLDRVDTLSTLGHNVLITNFPLFSQLHVELRRFTSEYICMVIGATTLPNIFGKHHYSKYPGGIMSALGLLFDEKSRFYVYPYKTEKECTTASSFSPTPDVLHLYKHLRENKFILDLENCDDVDTTLHSEGVRKLLSVGNPKWEELVPPAVRDLIKKRKLFDYKG